MKTYLRFFIFMALFLFFWGGMTMSPLSAGTNRAEERSIYVGLIGGYSHSESQGGMADLRGEFQFSLSPSLKLGLGLGYLGNSGRMSGMGNGGMMQGMMGGGTSTAMGFDDTFRSTPLTLTAYLRKPLSNSAGAILFGGVGYYWSRYRDITVQKKGAFGSYLGLGADLRIARNILFFSEASYRFVTLRGFRPDLHPGTNLDQQGHRMDGFWYFNQGDGALRFHAEDGHMDQFLGNLPLFDINLNGFSLGVGLKFGF
jgi:hypothetical protein